MRFDLILRQQYDFRLKNITQVCVLHYEFVYSECSYLGLNFICHYQNQS